jgi:hypothetical protein
MVPFIVDWAKWLEVKARSMETQRNLKIDRDERL